jgi:hypothetical protein
MADYHVVEGTLVQLQFVCVDCGYRWSIDVADEPVIRIGMYEDVCPGCGCQNEPDDILVLAEV